MFGFDRTRDRLLHRARWIAAGLSASLILFVLVFDLGVKVNASLLLTRQSQGGGTAAPSKPIRPVSVSVINFAKLAAQQAKADRELQPNVTPSQRVVRPPRELVELDVKDEYPAAAESAKSNLIQPLVSSPAPSQSFLAQEDAPQAGTGSFVIPPDTTGAVGTDKIFVTVNNNYRVQDKTTGTALSTVSIDAFWSSTGAADVFDPRVQYDPYNNRWIVAATSNEDTANSSLLVGVSATSDPQGTFTLFRFVVGCAAGAMNCDANGETADFPMLGFNKNWVAVSWNQFQIAGSGSLVAGKIMAIDYPSLRSGTSNSTVFTVTPADSPAAASMHPATTLSATEDSLYVPAHVSSAGALYRLHKLTGTPNAPIYLLDTVSRTRPGGGWTPPGGDILPQTCVGTPGSTCPTTPRLIDAPDAFIRSNVVFRNGNIWYPQTIALPAGGLGQPSTHTAAQWTRIDTSGNFVDGGRVEDPTATATNGREWYAYASIAVNVNNDALLGFSSFGSSHFARAGYSLRLGTDSAGTMRDAVIFKEGDDYYAKTFGGSSNRWGDYSHSVVDPANDLDLWTIQEYAGTRIVKDSQQTTDSSRWGTWWAKVPPGGPPPSPTPTPTPTPTPAPCPSVLTVNDNGDAGDTIAGDGVCVTAGGVCTLRAAIQEANARAACGTIDINFSGVTNPLSLTTALPDINHNVNINGPGANQLTVQRSLAGGTTNFRIFAVNSGRTVNISGLTMSNGNITTGNAPNNSGGAVGNNGTLTLTNIVASGNTAINGGGALFNNGTLKVIGSTLTGNSATSHGGGVYNVVGTTNLINTTVSGNSTPDEGGGVYSSNASLILTNVTVTNNRSDSDNNGNGQGGGISTSGGNATLKNTIVAGNFKGSGTTTNEFDGGGGIGGTIVSSSSYNIIGVGGSSGLSNGVNNNQVGVADPKLGVLTNNGGPTMTHALLFGSPALDAGSNSFITNPPFNGPPFTDQRDAGFDRMVNGTVDIGAFEAQSIPTPSFGTDQIVISEVYGGGGTAGATYPNSFVEVFNRGTTVVNLNSWLFQFAHSETGAMDFGISFSRTNGIFIQPGQYVLLQLGSSGPLPIAPDLTTNQTVIGPMGKIAMTRPGTAFFGGVSCPLPNAGISDFIGFGANTNCFEGSGPAPLLSNTTAALRKNGGCTDSDNNANDFVVGPPTLRNSASPLNPCGGSIQLSSSSHTVSEGNPIVNITLTRSGDASAGAIVTYVTSDAAGAQNCNVFNGNASSRCDYISALGMLNFAPGESSKTIPIHIIDDSYAEGPENFTISLSNPINATLGSQSAATVTINDNDASSGANPIDQANFFVRQHYLDFLNREPDAGGLAFWSNQITECQQPGATCNAALRRINVSAAFFLSIEFQETGYLVERLYKTSYGNAAGTSNFGPTHQLAVPIVRLNEFLPDTQEIGRGLVVGQTGWEQLLENNKVAFVAGFVQRSRFATAFPTSLTPAQFVDLLFANAGVIPTAAERSAAINEFGGAGNTTDTAARARALRRVAENSTLNQQEKNRAFVLMQFFGYLRRNPNDPQDTDYTGYDFWLSKLNEFNGDFIRAEMVKAFLDSTEYRARFGP